MAEQVVSLNENSWLGAFSKINLANLVSTGSVKEFASVIPEFKR